MNDGFTHMAAPITPVLAGPSKRNQSVGDGIGRFERADEAEIREPQSRFCENEIVNLVLGQRDRQSDGRVTERIGADIETARDKKRQTV